MTPRPHLLLAEHTTPGARSLEELRVTTATAGLPRRLWQGILADARADLDTPPLTAFAVLPKRGAEDIRRGNRDYIVVDAAGQRVLKAALAARLTGEPAFAAAALRQMDCLFDAEAWPEWQDIFHRQAHGFDADLRTGQLARDLGLAYDWLHGMWTPKERQRVVDGIDARGIQPYLRAMDAGAWWVERMNNWTTVIVGGLGICGMALGEDHPRSDQLVELADAAMHRYMGHYGPAGEFNENPAYANSSWMPVLYYSIRRSQFGEGAPPPQIADLRQHAYWCLYATAPPGELVAFGDGGPGYPALTAFMPAIAAATRDPVLQWFYLTYGEPARFPVWELLWFDDSLEPQPPTPASLPPGRAYDAHSGLISSRADWDPAATPSLVFSKAGHGGVNHTHPDGGQVEIHGHGQRLIVDLGSVPYPARDAQRYYHFSSEGHNQLTFGGRGQRWTRDGAHRAHRRDAAFDRERGAWWCLDLTELHEGVTAVMRTVVHLLPGVVAVLDEASLLTDETTRLRWHPAHEPEIGDAGALRLESAGVALQALVVRCHEDPREAGPEEDVILRLGHHEYRPPYDRDRMDNPMPQRREPCIDATTTGRRVTFLSLFAIGAPGADPGPWAATPSGWQCGDVTVVLDGEALTVAGTAGTWRVPRT